MTKINAIINNNVLTFLCAESKFKFAIRAHTTEKRPIIESIVILLKIIGMITHNEMETIIMSIIFLNIILIPISCFVGNMLLIWVHNSFVSYP